MYIVEKLYEQTLHYVFFKNIVTDYMILGRREQREFESDIAKLN